MQAVSNFISQVPVPKQVVIQNFRLGVLLNILKALAIAFVVFLTMSGQSYFRDVPVNGYPAFWTSSVQAEYDAAVAQDVAKAVCTQPEKFDYWYGKDWLFDDITCVEQFEEERKAYKAGLDSIFIPTFYVSTATKRIIAPSVDANGAPVCTGLPTSCPAHHGWKGVRSHTGPLCECQEQRSHFVMGMESIRMALEHHFVFKDKSASFLSSSKPAMQSNHAKCDDSDTDHWECLEKGQDMLSLVVLTNNDKVIEASHAPKPLSLKIGDILKAAEISLDETFDETLANSKKCGVAGSDPATCSNDVPLHPVLRMVGLEMNFQLDYVNNAYYPSNYKELDGHSGPLCIIKVTISKKWTAAPKTDCKQPRDSATSELDCVQNYWHGIRISIHASGHFAVFDPQNLLVTIGAGLVYLGIPLQIVALIAVTCLGPASKVYTRGVKQDMKVDDEFTELVAKAFTTAHTFKQATADKKMNRATFHAEISSVFKCDDIDEKEMRTLVDVAFDRFLKHHDGDASDPNAELSMHDFIASLQGEMSLTDAVALFDVDRKKSIMERLFKPNVSRRSTSKPKEGDAKVAPAPDEEA